MENLNEAKKLIATHTSDSGRHTAKVYRDPEYNEYQVHYFKDGKHLGEGPVGYHDDKEDAHASAKADLKRMDSNLKESRTFTGILESYAENRLKSIADMMISEEYETPKGWQDDANKAHKDDVKEAKKASEVANTNNTPEAHLAAEKAHLEANASKYSADDKSRSDLNHEKIAREHGKIARKLGGPVVHDLSKMSHADAYDETQVNPSIHDGDVLKLRGGAHAVQVEAWPVLTHGKHEMDNNGTPIMHGLNHSEGHTWNNLDGGKYKKSYEKASQEHKKSAITEEASEEEFNKELEITKKKATEKKSAKDEARVAKPAVQACEMQKEETEEQKKIKDEVDLKLSKWRNQQRTEKAMKNEQTEPQSAKEKELAAMGHPKDKITKKDVLIGRGVLAKEEAEEVEEAVGDDYVNKTEKLRQAGAKEMSLKDKLKSIPRGFKAMTKGESEDDRRIMKNEQVEELDERELTSSEQKSKEKNVKGMKKSLLDFKKRYGERAKEVMYATATKMAKEEVEE